MIGGWRGGGGLSTGLSKGISKGLSRGLSKTAGFTTLSLKHVVLWLVVLCFHSKNLIQLIKTYVILLNCCIFSEHPCAKM